MTQNAATFEMSSANSAPSQQIRRYKASSAVMEKATEVYNKLKLQFVGKLEVNKPKPQEKGEEENKTESQSTGDLSW